ncbi:hypothetical protein IGI04_035493 [Brassica rapa subsp. trilocularis]|uniref:Uncharacterized protein n=1 Tax=Brassica rapa subsp. trilocularis TaxID=1813537 RepID=A0ABQ7LBV8_BRACM|nr:hypothetical protein IGI04_035493 [Brassica rapa subsp. trilocularis]
MNLKRCVFEEEQTVNSTRLQFDLYNWPERYDGGVSSLKQLNFVDWKTKKHDPLPPLRVLLLLPYMVKCSSLFFVLYSLCFLLCFFFYILCFFSLVFALHRLLSSVQFYTSLQFHHNPTIPHIGWVILLPSVQDTKLQQASTTLD